MSPGREHKDRALLAVLDTNTWRSTQLLKDPRSAALLYALDSVGGKIGMPEVIEREVFKHGVAMGRLARESIEKNLRTIRALLGESPGVRLPTDQDFETVVNGRLAELEHLFHRVSFTAEIALRALDRVDLKQPPSAAGQQYKDSVIWEHCLDLAGTFDVHLITADKAFYQQGNYQRGLDERLRSELADRKLHVSIHANIEPLLIGVSANVSSSFDPSAAGDAIQDATIVTVRRSLESDGWVLGDRRSATFDAFVTERIDTLFLNFVIEYATRSGSDAAVTSRAVVEGQGMYRPAAAAVTDVRLSVIKKYIVDEFGVVERKHVFGHLNAALGGPPPIPYEVRAPLPGGSEFRAINVFDGASFDDSVSDIEST